MEDSTNQPTNESAREPTNESAREPTNEPAKKKKKPTSAWVAVISALAAIAALAISVWQVHLANQQNAVTEQDHLLQLTTAIAEQIAQGQTTSNQATALTASGEIVSKLTIEGQAGTVLINDLKVNGVAAWEYIEVAQALAYGGNAATAITDYKAALKAPPHDAWTRASALRYMGILYYQIEEPRKGHQTLVQAAKVVSEEHPLNARSYVANIIAQAYVVDAYYQLTPYQGCSTAQDDMQAERKVMGSYAPTSIVKVYADAVNKAYQAKCTGSP